MVNHGAPESEELITREHFNKRLRGQFPTSGIKIYNKVTVLSIYWQADYMGCIKEARAINKLFSDEFGYEVKEFAIPSEKSYLALLKEITNLIEEHGLRGSLLIVYYGGHGDSDEKDQRYGSVWTAYVSLLVALQGLLQMKGCPKLTIYLVQATRRRLRRPMGSYPSVTGVERY